MATPNLSSADAAIVALLQKNARISNRELARAAGIAESTCLDHVRSLERRGVIAGYHAEVDLPAIGRSVRALINVRLQPKTTESVRSFQHDVLAARETLSVRTVSGADDFIVEVAVADVHQLEAFVLDVITSRHDVVDTRTSLVYEHERNQIIDALPGD